MENNNGVLKGMLIALVVLYVISPLDFCPGPIDDVLVLLFTAAMNRNKSQSRSLLYGRPDEE